MTSVKAKKRFMYFTFSCLFLFDGIEYAVILPTLWLYLKNTYDSPGYMLGIVLSSYSLATFFSSPIIGRLADRTGRTKEILAFCYFVQTIGSILYCLGISQWLAVASRFICGIGGASEAVALAEISRYTTEQELTGIISKMVSMRQIALLASPGLNLVLRLVDFKIGPVVINNYTVPGAFMAVLWFSLILITCAFYTEPRKIFQEEKKLMKLARREKKRKLNKSAVHRWKSSLTNSKDTATHHMNGSIKNSDTSGQTSQLLPHNDVMGNTNMIDGSTDGNGQFGVGQNEDLDDFRDSWSVIDHGEFSPLLKSSVEYADIQSSVTTIDSHMTNMDDLLAKEGMLGFCYKEYIRDDVMAIMMLLFCAWFSQVALEAMCTPLSLEYLDFGEVENSILYCLCGVEIVAAFLTVSFLSKYVADRNMIIFGELLLLSANICLISFLPTAPKHDRSKNLPFVAFAVALDVMSLPFLLVCATSLYSKMIRKQAQGLSQGLRRGLVGLGTILAPLWATSIVIIPYIVIGVLIGIQSLSLIMCILSYKGLKARVQEPTKPTRSRSIPRSRHVSTTNIDHASTRSARVDDSSLYGSISSFDVSSNRDPKV